MRFSFVYIFLIAMTFFVIITFAFRKYRIGTEADISYFCYDWSTGGYYRCNGEE